MLTGALLGASIPFINQLELEEGASVGRKLSKGALPSVCRPPPYKSADTQLERGRFPAQGHSQAGR